MHFEISGPSPTTLLFRFKKQNSDNFCGGQNWYFKYSLGVDYTIEHQSTYQTLRKYQWGHLRTVADSLTADFLYFDLEKYQNSLLQQNLL
jgi:hypothetical protein